jgi:hypothetical protein
MPESGVRKMTTLIEVDVRLLGPLMRGALTAASAVIAGKTATRRVSAITGTDHNRHDRALTSARRSAAAIFAWSCASTTDAMSFMGPADSA